MTNSTKNLSPFSGLPADIVGLILDMLPNKDLLGLRLVSKQTKNMVDGFIGNPVNILQLLDALDTEQQKKFIAYYIKTEPYIEAKKKLQEKISASKVLTIRESLQLLCFRRIENDAILLSRPELLLKSILTMPSSYIYWFIDSYRGSEERKQLSEKKEKTDSEKLLLFLSATPLYLSKKPPEEINLEELGGVLERFKKQEDNPEVTLLLQNLLINLEVIKFARSSNATLLDEMSSKIPDKPGFEDEDIAFEKERKKLSEPLCELMSHHAPQTYSNLGFAHVIGASLQGQEMNNKYLSNASFSQVDFSNAKMQGCFLQLEINASNLQSADLRGAKIIDSAFNFCNLAEANLHNVVIQTSRFVGGNLNQTNLQNAKLQSCNIEHTYMTKTKLPFANLYKINMNKSSITDSVFMDTTIKSSKFGRVKISGGSFQRAKISTTDFDLCELQNIHFQNAIISRVNFKGVSANTVNFDGTKFSQVQFDSLSSFVNCNFNNTDLRGLKIKGARFENCTFDGARVINKVTPENIIHELASLKNLLQAEGKETNVHEWRKVVATNIAADARDLAKTNVSAALNLLAIAKDRPSFTHRDTVGKMFSLISSTDSQKILEAAITEISQQASIAKSVSPKK